MAGRVASFKKYNVKDQYQRRLSNLSTFVPNSGFESGVYLRYIVDNYFQLPRTIVFLQADLCGVNIRHVLHRLDPTIVSLAGGYLPLNCAKVLRRGLEAWGGDPTGYLRKRVQTCWSAVLKHFQLTNLLYSNNASELRDDGSIRVNMV